jgi:tetratricopeptide (TPR) repeat protein
LIATLDTNRGDLAYAKHDYPLAVAYYQRSIDVAKKGGRGGFPFAIEAEVGLGSTLLALGKPQEAIASIEQALGGGHSVELLDLAAAQFVLARAQLAAGRSRGAALQLAEKARANFVQSGQTGTAALAELDTWLQAQR